MGLLGKQAVALIRTVCFSFGMPSSINETNPQNEFSRIVDTSFKKVVIA
jgi:hypothetical protein